MSIKINSVNNLGSPAINYSLIESGSERIRQFESDINNLTSELIYKVMSQATLYDLKRRIEYLLDRISIELNIPSDFNISPFMEVDLNQVKHWIYLCDLYGAPQNARYILRSAGPTDIKLDFNPIFLAYISKDRHK